MAKKRKSKRKECVSKPIPIFYDGPKLFDSVKKYSKYLRDHYGIDTIAMEVEPFSPEENFAAVENLGVWIIAIVYASFVNEEEKEVVTLQVSAIDPYNPDQRMRPTLMDAEPFARFVLRHSQDIKSKYRDELKEKRRKRKERRKKEDSDVGGDSPPPRERPRSTGMTGSMIPGGSALPLPTVQPAQSGQMTSPYTSGNSYRAAHLAQASFGRT